MPASGPAKEEKMFPAAVMEDQEEIMSGGQEPVTVGMAPFSSQDPETDVNKMMSTSGTPEEGGQELQALLSAVPDEEKKAGEWVDAVKATRTAEELDEVEERYAEVESADFKSVDDALDKRRTELEEEAAEAEETSEEEG